MSSGMNRDELLRDMLKNGFRVTEQRKAMLQLVLQYKQSFSAIELYHEMEKHFRGLSYGTVYQNLKMLAKLRVVETFAVNNEVRYRLVERRQPKLHLICMECNDTIFVDIHPAQLEMLPDRSFTTVDYKLDVFGYCPDCSNTDG
jgi:Fe2+ or Zn2+ uptake regulation protein